MSIAVQAQTYRLQISEVSFTQHPQRCIFKHTKHIYVKICCGNIFRRTDEAMLQPGDKACQWMDTLVFNDYTALNLTIEVLERRKLTIGKDKLIGELASPLDLSKHADPEASSGLEHISLPVHNGESIGTVEFSLRLDNLKESSIVSPSSELSQELVSHAKSLGLSKTTQGMVDALSGVTEGAEAIEVEYGTWKSLILRIGLVIAIVDKIAAIHPYAQMAWSMLSGIAKMVISQNKRDTNIETLLKAMKDMYDFIDLTNTLKDMDESRLKIVKAMFQQTYECAWFIRSYISRGNLVMRGINAVASGHDKKVQGYIDLFSKLKAGFQDRSSIGTESFVRHALATLENVAGDQLLDEIRCALGLSLPKECMPETRECVLKDIVDWINRPPEEEERCVYWLHGVAGCGKSAIASTIAREFRELKRCAYFFFNAMDQSRAAPDRLFGTLSRTLADCDPQWKASLVEIIRDSWELRTTSNVKDQFENFILRPAAEFQSAGPILIVIDAMDESASEKGRAQLLNVVSRLNEVGRHGHFRFLITSRPERDIQNAFANKPWVLAKDLASVDTGSTEKDIRRYVNSEIFELTELDNTWSGEPWLDLLVDRSQCLFQWAFVACKFVKGTRRSHSDSKSTALERYLCLRDGTSGLQQNGLDKLYMSILSKVFGSDKDAKEVARFRTILGRVLCVREPLSLGALTSLRRDDERVSYTQQIIRPLGSLLKGTEQDNEPIQPLHISFMDFLSDPKRSQIFSVNQALEEGALALSCLREMNTLLRFNLCHLKSSFDLNSEIKDLKSRVTQNVPEYLSYACRYFASHLERCGEAQESTSTLEGFVKKLLHEKFLNWLEALSLLRGISQAPIQLMSLRIWLQTRAQNSELVGFVTDGEYFVRAFSRLIAISVPHIYLSLLAFVPSTSPISQKYSPKYPGGLRVNSDYTQKITWMPEILSIEREAHQGPPITCVGFSPDGNFFASGTYEGRFEVWDAYTAQNITSGPLISDTLASIDDPEGYVSHPICTAIAFSPDGKRLVLGYMDGCLRVYDAYSSEPIAGPLEGHTDSVKSVTFSPDNKLIVSGSQDYSLRIWDSQTGSLKRLHDSYEKEYLWLTFAGFWVGSKRMKVVSQLDNCSICVCDVDTGVVVSGPLYGHEEEVTSVAFSNDGNLLVSGSTDGELWVWPGDTIAYEIVGPLKGHTGPVTTVKFSSDDSFIVSGSDDFTVRIWSTRTGQPIAGPFSHADGITSVAISPDCKRIVSSSIDKSIRLWSAGFDELYRRDFSQDHSSRIALIEVCPMGEFVVLGFKNGDIHVLDAYTGRVVSELINHTTDPLIPIDFSSSDQSFASEASYCRMWRAYNNENFVGTFHGHSDWVATLGYSPDGTYIVYETYRGTIRVFNGFTGNLIAGPLIYSPSTLWITAIAVSFDGHSIASGLNNGDIWIHDSNTGKSITGPIRGHTKAVSTIAFSSDGKYIVSGAIDGTICVWDASLGVPSTEPLPQSEGPMVIVGFSPNSKRVVLGSKNGAIHVWDICECKLIFSRYCGSSTPIASIRFSSDGRYIVSGSFDSSGSIQVWELSTGRQVGSTLGGHTCSITSVAFSSDGNRVISCSTDMNVRSWLFSDIEKNADHKLSLPTFSQKLKGTEDPLHDGWLGTPRICWTPPAYRNALWRPSNASVIGRNSVKLNFSDLKVGDEWEQCAAIA